MAYEVSGDPSIVTEEGYGNIDLEVEKDVEEPEGVCPAGEDCEE